MYEAKRFSKSDFLMLLNAEIKMLKECVECLKDYREDSNEHSIAYRADGAIHEAESMIRILTTDSDAAVDNEEKATKDQDEGEENQAKTT